jgi:hypothetical protein
MSRLGDSLGRFFFAGMQAERLGTTRFLLGIGLVPFFALQFNSFLKLDPLGPRFYLIDPVWYFDLLGITRLEPMLAQIGFFVLLASLTAFALGFRTRTSAVVSLLLIAALKGYRDSIAGDVHHRELIPFHLLLFFACSRSGEVFSLDVRRRARAAIEEWEATWPIRASQLYIAAFYWWSGYAKLRTSGVEWFGPERTRGILLERSMRFGLDDSGAAVGSQIGYWLAAHPWALVIPGLTVAAMELGFPLILWLRVGWQRIAFLAVVTAFHVLNYILLNVQFLFMPVVFVTFFDMSWLARRIAPRLAAPS